ncbi:hypothetical protein HYFRA_00004682 [Hymenoscyphus fraxineus]|uniref:C2 domain-containing protein n=1 Tax=Hymenoscyphus fraxineus TaxID=746836 RepID=A0A9N9PUQ7_9HELO|nr:hypothetical protein HYFRA_00004682 [Hymenoscyphus fraxineus]
MANNNFSRKHVMRDLKPYVCTSEDCDMKLFPDRHTWFTHELQNHWVEWKCCFCSHDSYPSRDKFEKHALTSHEDEFTEAQLPALVKVCQKPVEKISPDACPFCDEWENKLRELNEHMSTNETIVVTPQQFRHHVGRHMEQLALFAIPRGYKEDGDAGSSRAAPGHGSDNSSERSLVRPDYEDEVNPRIHVAAFEGSLDEVFSHFDSSELAPQSILALEGTTWGNVLSAAAAGGHLDIVELIIDQTREILSEDIPVDRKGWGPLHWAASNGHLDVVKLIIQKTLLSISQKTFDGFTAADLALQHGYDEISRILQPDEALSDIGTLDGGALLGGTQKLLRVTAYPDPFVQLSIDTKDVEKTYTTGVIKRTLNPYWNKYFDVNVTENSLLIFEVFDQKKSKKKDQGHLGRVDIRVGDVINLSEPEIGQTAFTIE